MRRTDSVLIVVALGCFAGVLGRGVLPYSVWLTTVSLLLGGGISGLLSWYFYKRAGDELRNESAKLRRHTTLILRGLEEAGLVEYNRDDQTGEITGMVIKISGVADGVGSASGTLTVGDAADTNAPTRRGSPEAAAEGPEESGR